MTSDWSLTSRMPRRWGTAAAFAAVAALPAIVMLALEAGTLTRVRSILYGAKVAPPQPQLLIPEADTIAWAWGIFFIVLALIYATDTGQERGGSAEPEPVDDFPEPAPEPEPEVRPVAEKKDRVESLLPEVQNLAEAQAWLKKGSELYAQGRYQEAMSRFDKALKLYPRLAGAWAGKGLACNAMRQYQEAIRCYDESLRLDPRDPAVWHDKGNSLSALGRLEGALNCYNEALILDSRDARAWNNKGICLASLGRLDEAIACCDKALALSPSYLVAWQARAMIEERRGRLPDAIAAYERFIEFSPDGNAAAVQAVRQRIIALESIRQSDTQTTA